MKTKSYRLCNAQFIFGGEKIVCIYMTRDGFFKIVDALYSQKPDIPKCLEERDQYKTLKISQEDYSLIHAHMLKAKVDHLTLRESIDRMAEFSKGRHDHNYRILDSIIWSEYSQQTFQEEEFIDRLFMEFL